MNNFFPLRGFGRGGFLLISTTKYGFGQAHTEEKETDTKRTKNRNGNGISFI